MESEKIGKFIYKLRNENGISQESLAKELFVDRSLISKWENGKLSPDIKHINRLCKIFNVRIEELLSGERLNSNNNEELNNNLFDYLFKNDNKYKRMKTFLIILFLSFLLLTIVFLIYYFYQTYNSISIYKVSFGNDYISSSNGLLILTREDSYLKFENISNGADKIIFYYYDDNNIERILYEGNPNGLISDYYGYNSSINAKNFNDLKDKLYIKLDGNSLKINFVKLYSNTSLFQKNYDKLIEEEYNYENFSIPHKIMQYFNCSEATCSLKDDNIYYVYDIYSTNLHIYNDEINIIYNVQNCIFFNDVSENNFSINKSNKIKCFSNKCEREFEIYNYYYKKYIEKYI